MTPDPIEAVARPCGYDPAKVAAGLTPARKAMVLALPADGSWGAVPSRAVAKRTWWKMMPGIIDHKHCPTDRDEWALSTFGIAVRAALIPEPDTIGYVDDTGGPR